MKKFKSYLIISLGLGLLLSVKLLFFPAEKKGANARKDAKKGGNPISVFVVGNKSLDDKLIANGTLVAQENADLRVQASGIITHLYLPEGKVVDEGTLLLKVNDADLKAQFEKIKVQIKLAKEIEDRQAKLFKSQGISAQEYDITRSNLSSLKADSAYVMAQIAKTEIRAPFTGVLGIKNVSIGSYITPATVVTHIQQTHPIKVEFSVPEKYARLFNVGDALSFKTEGQDKSYTAKVTVKESIVDLNSRSVRYHATTGNTQGALLPGAFAKVELALKDKPNALFVPTDAIIPVLKGKKVYIVKNGIALEKIVETGLRTEDHIQILSGLSVGDSVVLDGNTQLKTGHAVKVPLGKKKQV